MKMSTKIIKTIRYNMVSTDHGRSMKSFFIEILNFWAWANKLGR